MRTAISPNITAVIRAPKRIMKEAKQAWREFRGPMSPPVRSWTEW